MGLERDPANERSVLPFLQWRHAVLWLWSINPQWSAPAECLQRTKDQGRGEPHDKDSAADKGNLPSALDADANCQLYDCWL